MLLTDGNANTPGPNGKRIKRAFPLLLAIFEPPFRPECLDVHAPNSGVAVDCVAGDGEDGAGGESLLGDDEATCGTG